MITMVDMMSGTERAPMVVMMPCIAAMPIPVMCPATMNVPPTRVVTPIPRTAPCYPCGTPEPIVDNRTIDVHRFDDIVGAIYIFITYDLHRDLVLLIFLHID
jgi:hypothetical protein